MVELAGMHARWGLRVQRVVAQVQTRVNTLPEATEDRKVLRGAEVPRDPVVPKVAEDHKVPRGAEDPEVPRDLVVRAAEDPIRAVTALPAVKALDRAKKVRRVPVLGENPIAREKVRPIAAKMAVGPAGTAL
ncbi:hypothetical protein A3C37_00070 [Candidatus Peribacteria bacterium RIFCSPHIGHO2_02_FULL_53_20]|nr:MAG: hypothetical protein A3C37_00070 [Candidatus Peribacteria bacterium RIFCSPHIGHO2_02_FULL_53_20]OGJ68179.1 MAG: hypothetical protein A3B61_05220 [Candidatus Peribacteria bacterium RIFCSPLOWO2_01_FULL_53_10]